MTISDFGNRYFDCAAVGSVCDNWPIFNIARNKIRPQGSSWASPLTVNKWLISLLEKLLITTAPWLIIMCECKPISRLSKGRSSRLLEFCRRFHRPVILKPYIKRQEPIIERAVIYRTVMIRQQQQILNQISFRLQRSVPNIRKAQTGQRQRTHAGNAELLLFVYSNVSRRKPHFEMLFYVDNWPSSFKSLITPSYSKATAEDSFFVLFNKTFPNQMASIGLLFIYVQDCLDGSKFRCSVGN